MEQRRELGLRPGDDDLGRLAAGDELGEVVDERDVVRFLVRLLAVAAAARRAISVTARPTTKRAISVSRSGR